MPLLHQDNSRGGGGSEIPSRPCRSFAEFLELEKVFSEPVGAPASSRNDSGDYWSWESPDSPEAAQTPRARVPPSCFPPRHPRAFASYSESAQPGGMWNGGTGENCNGNDHGTRDLVSSLKALALPGRGVGPNLATSPPHPFTPFETSIPPWQSELCNVQLSDESRSRPLARPSSYCGVVSSDRNGSTWLRWSGKLPARDPDPDGGFSPKLFLGGLPWDVTESGLSHALRHFHPLRVEWPGRETGASPRGFAYVTLESERRVRALLGACRRDGPDWKYRLHSRKLRTKEVQVIPWAVSDANWVVAGSARLEAARTVFVGALHGMLSAAALANIMNDLFPGVVYAGIDTDKNKYPIGSGRVTFNNVRSYVRAISAAYVEINTDKFSKKVQVDPYLEDSMCSVCNLQQGPYFCREPTCFGYFCRSCWSWQHATEAHKPLMRNCKSAPPSAPAAAPRPPQHGAPPPAPPGGPLANGHRSARYSPQSDLYGGTFTHPSDSTPSPSTSGSGQGASASGSGSDDPRAEAGAGASDSRADSACDWPLQ